MTVTLCNSTMELPEGIKPVNALGSALSKRNPIPESLFAGSMYLTDRELEEVDKVTEKYGAFCGDRYQIAYQGFLKLMKKTKVCEIFIFSSLYFIFRENAVFLSISQKIFFCLFFFKISHKRTKIISNPMWL